MRGRRIAALSTLVVALSAACFVLSLPPRRDSGSTATDRNPGGRGLDFSDADTRNVVLKHERSLRTWNLPSFECGHGSTRLRVVHQGGLEGGTWLAAELRIQGRYASLDIRELRVSPEKSGRAALSWEPLASRWMPRTAVEGIETQMETLIGVTIEPELNPHFVDTPRFAVEACRDGRYKLFVFSQHPDDPDVERVTTLVRSVLRLAGKQRAARWIP